jgi:N-acetylglutamate synthase-like GNAT family acetyltransferase
MILRSFRDEDIPAIDKIWRDHHSSDFSVPDRRNKIVDAVVVENEKIIGYGQVKLFAEAMLILDLSASRRQKVDAIKLLMAEAFRGCDQAGIHQVYAFIKDPLFATLISKHFGFEIVDKGELLLREEV